MMLAAIYRRTGAAEVIEIEEVDTPQPAAGEVRVRVHVSGVNPTDWKARSGATGRPLTAPFQVPHQDGAGIIDAVGAGVGPERVGQRVWICFAAWQRPWGTAAQWSVVPAECALPLPDDASYELGASLGIPALTAHRCLFADGAIDGRTILVAGGAGAVGRAAIQLACWAGARVMATASGDEKRALARAAGAELAVDYRDAAAADELRTAVPGGVDRVVEVDLARNLDLDLAVSAPYATIACYAADVAEQPVLPVRRLMAANLLLRFVLVYTMPAEARAAAAADVSAALRAHALSPLPVHRFPLEAIADAHAALEDGIVGKVLVDIP